jgi:hypothetical protein
MQFNVFKDWIQTMSKNIDTTWGKSKWPIEECYIVNGIPCTYFTQKVRSPFEEKVFTEIRVCLPGFGESVRLSYLQKRCEELGYQLLPPHVTHKFPAPEKEAKVEKEK